RAGPSLLRPFPDGAVGRGALVPPAVSPGLAAVRLQHRRPPAHPGPGGGPPRCCSIARPRRAVCLHHLCASLVYEAQRQVPVTTAHPAVTFPPFARGY